MSGLGSATATALAKRGAKVTIFDLNEELGQGAADEIGGAYHSVDVTREANVRDAIALAQQKNGIARILVNCAGIAPPSKVIGKDGSAAPLEKFSKIIEINLVGTFNVLSQFAAQLHTADTDEDKQRGVVVSTASIAAFEGQIGQSAYAASKAGVVGMTLPIAREFARYGIRVMAIAPGIFWTPMLASLPQEAQDSLGQQVPFPSRLGKTQEFARLVLSIIDNPMLNGDVIRLDGALRMGSK